MQTFLPFADFDDSCAVLDTRRLGKQRVETFQILRALTWPQYAWKNHPAVRMWRGFVPALVCYGLANCAEWTARGYADTVSDSLLEFTEGKARSAEELAHGGELPPWLGMDELHLSHQSALLRKDPAWYRPLFGGLRDDLPYLWPRDLLPRWPIRPSAACPSLAECLDVLGFEGPWTGQAEAAQAVADGDDCLAEFGPGAGARGAGLLAGLLTGGSTLWVKDDDAPRGRFDSAEVLPSRTIVTPARPTTPSKVTARQPTAEDKAAMAAEVGPAPWRFLRSDQLPSADLRPALLVVQHAQSLPAKARRTIAAARPSLGSPPMLVLTDHLTPAVRARLSEHLGMADPRRAIGE